MFHLFTTKAVFKKSTNNCNDHSLLFDRSSEGDDWCKWVHIFLCGGQFYCIFISAWCFSSLIHTCSSPWNFIIMCISVGISGIVGCFIVTCEINIPEQEPETGKITGKTRTFFIVAVAFCAATVFLSLGSLAKVSDPNSESKDKTYTSLMILLNSFTQGSDCHLPFRDFRLIACFSSKIFKNLDKNLISKNSNLQNLELDLNV